MHEFFSCLKDLINIAKLSLVDPKNLQERVWKVIKV